VGNQDYHPHPTATIDEGARIGARTRIWHYSHVCASAWIGDDCTVGQNCYIDRNVSIGSHVKIQNNVSVYQGVTVEDYAFLGPSCVFTNVLTPRSAFPRNNPDTDYIPTQVRLGASVGANATICCGIELGAWCVVGAGAVVTADVLPHAVVVGVPARQSSWACHCGAVLQLTDGDTLVCPEARCGRQYTLDSGLLKLSLTPGSAKPVQGLD
jgi:UDP-2-acetamido-3-amino-2,3-dideoxy-glucuronate N-acetyltransferase